MDNAVAGLSERVQKWYASGADGLEAK